MSGQPIKLDEIGIHHVSFWVDDLDAVYADLVSQGIEFAVKPTVVDTQDGKFKSAFLQDPDGILIQFDELLEG